MNPLSEHPRARRTTYLALWVSGLVLTGVQAYIGAADLAQPQWLTGALGVYPAVGAYVGFQAQRNTRTEDESRGIVRHDP